MYFFIFFLDFSDNPDYNTTHRSEIYTLEPTGKINKSGGLSIAI